MNLSALCLSTRPETASTACHFPQASLVSRNLGRWGDAYSHTPLAGSDPNIVRATCAPPAGGRGIVGKDDATLAQSAIRSSTGRSQRSSALCTLLLIGIWGYPATAVIDGITGPNFDLTAREDYISRTGGDRVPAWGYASGNGPMQYPGPTLIVNQGDVVTVTLRNALPTRSDARPQPVSIVFPEMKGVTARGGAEGLLTREAQTTDNPATPENEAIVTYTFTASRPGTYLYHTGTRMGPDVEMGLVGALIVRSDADRGKAIAETYSSVLATLYRDLSALIAGRRGARFDVIAHHLAHRRDDSDRRQKIASEDGSGFMLANSASGTEPGKTAGTFIEWAERTLDRTISPRKPGDPLQPGKRSPSFTANAANGGLPGARVAIESLGAATP